MEKNTPTEIIELPSKGLLYPSENPLSSGKIEMCYMTAKHEDILTNQSYIQKGIVIDKLLQALIISKINYSDLITGDKNAIMVAARILGYGKDYTFDYNGTEYNVDLTQIDNKPFEYSNKGINEFNYTLPSTNTNITYKILTHGDEQKIQTELEGLKKINKNASPELSTRLKYMITSVGGDREVKTIREFVDNHLLARDSRELRKHIKLTQPDVDLTFFPTNDSTRVDIPVGLKFFWPDL
tara:strand:+ start:38 stop:757 length:720 start_codon:yes stop_codon:yes gene_type:complete